MKFSNIPKSIREVFKNPKYFFLFVTLSIVVFSIYSILPAIGSPVLGIQDYFFKDFLIIFALSFLIGLLFTMQVYSFRQDKKVSVSGSSTGLLGFVSGFAVVLFSSATCVACLSVIFAFLSAGTLLTLMSYRTEIIIIGFVFIVVSLFLISNKIQKQCELCKV